MVDCLVPVPSATSVPGITQLLSSILQYQLWFKPPSTVTGTLTVIIVAQLGPGATAGNWKVELFEWIGKDDWTSFGDLTGG